MEEILRLKIKNSDSATIEVLPVEDGVEILVLRKSAKKPKIEFHDERKNSNLEVLRAFCSKQKEQCITKADKGELKRFWDFYEGKMEEWKGKVEPDKLFEKWQKTAK